MQKMFAQDLFQKLPSDLSPWEIQLVRMMEVSVQNAVFKKKSFLKRDEKWRRENTIPCTKEHLAALQAYVEKIPDDQFQKILERLETSS